MRQSALLRRFWKLAAAWPPPAQHASPSSSPRCHAPIARAHSLTCCPPCTLIFCSEDLRAELFCQLAKQLTDNEAVPKASDGSRTSAARGWTLLAMALTSFEPPGSLADELEAWLWSRGGGGGGGGGGSGGGGGGGGSEEATDCLVKMHQARIAGGLREVPPQAEIAGDLGRRPAEFFWGGERERILLRASEWEGKEKPDQEVTDWRA